MPTIKDLEPWFSAIGALLSVATLGFIANLARLLGDAAKARVEIGEDRLKAAKENWSESVWISSA